MSAAPDTEPLPSAAPARILLVDDNPAFVENLVEILTAAGHEVRTARTCAEARRLAEDGFEVALVDVNLPDGDGTALAGALKEVSADSEVILLTGFASLESATAAVRAGACAYLLKPCATPELLLALEQAMRQVRLQQERRALSRRAQVAEKLAAVGTLTAGLSHEIRNPLNAATLQLSVLERRVKRLPEPLQDPLQEPLSLVRDEIHRLDQILVDFLQFARPTQFQPSPVELRALLERVWSLHREEASRRGIDLQLRCEGPARVSGDEGRLQQVLVNLLLNALQAVPAGGWVGLTCTHDGPWVRLVLEDDGPGFPEALHDRIFEPFFTTKPSGSGLGLPIINAIVSQHGGEVIAERGARGGARFTVRLPALR